MRWDIVTKERQFEVPNQTVTNTEDGEMFEDGFDAPVGPILLEDCGGKTWGIRRDEEFEGVFALGDLC